ncbi:MAG: hypothetical protein AAF153_01805, partial [Pseudomonadota bacterium]
NPRIDKETVVAWQHLKQAGLFDEAPENTAIDYQQQTSLPTMASEDVFPMAKFDRSFLAILYTDALIANSSSRFYSATVPNKLNHLFIMGLEADWDRSSTVSTVMTTSEAFNIDTKMDDGLPISGRVQASSASSMNEVFYTPAGSCVASSAYTDLGTNVKACNIFYTLKIDW